MSEQIISPITPAPEQESTEEDSELNSYDNINSACNALWAIADFDDKIAKQGKKIKQIRRYAIDIIHQELQYIHSCYFDETEEDDD